MITYKDFYAHIGRINRNELEAKHIEAIQFVDEVTEKGTDWSVYRKDKSIRRVINELFRQLSELIDKKSTKPQAIKPTPAATKAPVPKPSVTKSSSVKPTVKPSVKVPSKPTPVRQTIAKNNPSKQTAKNNLRVVKRTGQRVERISEELKMLNRYVNLHGKNKEKNHIRAFLNTLQRAITEKRIRKTSPFAADVLKLQDNLILLHDSFKGSEQIQVVINEKERNHLLNVVGKQELMTSVQFIKSYISLQGKTITNKQATSLFNRITKAISNHVITQRDPYWEEVDQALSNLKTFVKKNKTDGVLSISSRELHGLNGILSGHGAGLNGLGFISEQSIVKGSDLIKMNFRTLGFKGVWKNFIGDPNPGFTAMVYGKPKFGKSILCIRFADYLSRNHGSVLYVAREERIGGTLKEKAQEMNASEVDFVSAIPSDLSDYEFVFLDSISKLGLSPEDLDQLRIKYPRISFVFVFQTTKQGAFRGQNSYQHDVDVVIELPEPGKAIQYGRYNQGGEMDLFES
jgi:hypothetical protein